MKNLPDRDSHTYELELSPYICKAVCDLCANYTEDYQYFNERLQKLIDEVDADAKRQESTDSHGLLDELKFTQTFIAKKVINEFCAAA